MSSSEGEVSSSDESHPPNPTHLEEGELPLQPGNHGNHGNRESDCEEDSLEEGEVSEDEGVGQVSVCRFFGKGLCTWGGSCRWVWLFFCYNKFLKPNQIVGCHGDEFGCYVNKLS